ncbi:MAG: sulfite exporter TauE/SafE family protein [Acidimicrobiia bacterium]
MVELAAFILLGLFAGFLASTLGIGGGIIFVPALVAIFGFTQLEAQGTSLAIIVGTAIVATIGHARKKRVDWKAAAAVGVGSIVGAFGGAQLAYELDEQLLTRIFAVLLLILAVRMAHHAWSVRPSAALDGGVDDA